MKVSKQVAKNYALALVDLTSGDNLDLLETILSEIISINEITSLFKSARQVFENPGISKEEKRELLKKLFDGKVNKKVLNFLFLLIDRQRFNLLPEIQKQLSKLLNEKKGIVVAEVSSAVELTSTILEDLRQRLEAMFKKNKKVTIESRVEPSLIGGLKVKIDDLVFDGSVKGRLEGLKQKLGC